MSLHILFDGPPGHDGGRFIEVEDDSGKSVNAGPWSQRPDGLWELTIDANAPLLLAQRDKLLYSLKCILNSDVGHTMSRHQGVAKEAVALIAEIEKENGK